MEHTLEHTTFQIPGEKQQQKAIKNLINLLISVGFNTIIE